MPKDLNDVAPSRGEVSTLYVAVEVSDKSWVVGIGDPGTLARSACTALGAGRHGWSPGEDREGLCPQRRSAPGVADLRGRI